MSAAASDQEDGAYPTIAGTGTGTEDYFGGAWNFDVPGQGDTEFSMSCLGLPQVIRTDGLYRSQQRSAMYRWRILDPIHFHQDVTVHIQAPGCQSGYRYNPCRTTSARPVHGHEKSPAVFCLDRPVANRPAFPQRDRLQIGGEPTDAPT